MAKRLSRAWTRAGRWSLITSTHRLHHGPTRRSRSRRGLIGEMFGAIHTTDSAATRHGGERAGSARATRPTTPARAHKLEADRCRRAQDYELVWRARWRRRCGRPRAAHDAEVSGKAGRRDRRDDRARKAIEFAGSAGLCRSRDVPRRRSRAEAIRRRRRSALRTTGGSTAITCWQRAKRHGTTPPAASQKPPSRSWSARHGGVDVCADDRDIRRRGTSSASVRR